MKLKEGKGGGALSPDFIRQHQKINFNVCKLNGHVLQTVQYSKYVEQPHHQDNDNNSIQNIFNGALHGNIAVYQPENDPDNDNNDKNS